MYVTAVKKAQNDGTAGAAERRTKSIAYGNADDCSCRDTKTHAEQYVTLVVVVGALREAQRVKQYGTGRC